MSKIIIGSDHAGYQLKRVLTEKLNNYDLVDIGCHSDVACDYPDFAEILAKEIARNHNNFGILICGSGIGVSIAANKFKKIRAALCINEEMAKLARQHNNANILCLGARLIDVNLAIKIINKFLNTKFLGGRHELRIKKIS